jgi:isoamylase
VVNFSGARLDGYRVGVPRNATYREVLNTDAAAYGGSDVGNHGSVTASDQPSHGRPYSLRSAPAAGGTLADTVIAAKPRIEAGLPYPLGATWDGKGVNFALFSANAERVELCIFDARGRRELARVTLPEYTDEVWHGYLPDARPGRCTATASTARTIRRTVTASTTTSCCSIPYAKALAASLRWSDAHYGYRIGSRASRPLVRPARQRRRDAQVRRRRHRVHLGRRSPAGGPWTRRCSTNCTCAASRCQHPGVPPALRGTFAGWPRRRRSSTCVDLGVTTLELLPVHAFVDDRRLVEAKLRNYWGYNSIGFFAPEPRYLAGDPDEFKTMVKHLHEAGIEVVLDVVYNHTAEGNHLGPTLSFAASTTPRTTG